MMMLNPYAFGAAVTYPVFISETGTTGGNVGDQTIAWPTPHAVDDLAIMVVESANQTVPTPTGWTAVPSGTDGVGTAGGTDGLRISLFYRFATSASMGNVTILDSGDHNQVKIFIFRDVDTVSPFNAISSSVSATSTFSHTLPSVTTTVDGCLVLLIAGVAWDTFGSSIFSGWSCAGLTSVTEIGDEITNAGNGGGSGVATGKRRLAGATGTGSVTLGVTSPQVCFTLALAPA